MARDELTMIGASLRSPARTAPAPTPPPPPAPLGAHAGGQRRQRRGKAARALDLLRIGGAHPQTQLAIAVPGALREAGQMLVQQRLAGDAGQALVLQIITARVRGAAQQ